jgi:hypothetical protein
MLRHTDYCIGTYDDIVYVEIGERSSLVWVVDQFGRPACTIPPPDGIWSYGPYAEYRCQRFNMLFGTWQEVVAHWAVMPDDEAPEPA